MRALPTFLSDSTSRLPHLHIGPIPERKAKDTRLGPIQQALEFAAMTLARRR